MLNSYFVPVYTSNEKYWKKRVSEEEAALHHSITSESVNKNLGYGDVHVFMIGPDGHVRNTIGVVRAAQNDNLRKFLEQCARDWNLKAGPPVVKPRPQSQAPASTPPGSLILHVTAKGANEGDWRQIPAENWIVLTAEESRKLLAPQGTTWEVDKDLAKKLFTTFYPQTEDTDSTDRNQFGKYSLRAKVVSNSGGTSIARLDGTLEMGRSFYPGRPGLTPIRAEVVGFLKFASDRSRVDAIELVTSKAIFGEEEFSAALRSGYEPPAP